MRVTNHTLLIVLACTVLFTAGAGQSTLSLADIVAGVKNLQSDAKEYSGLVDMAFKELRNEDSGKLHDLTDKINARTGSIHERSKEIAKEVEAYQSSGLQDIDDRKIKKISLLLQSTEQTFNAAFEQVGSLTKLVFKRNIQDILKILSRELDKSFKKANSYPDQLEKFSELVSQQPYVLSYKKIDAGHFRVDVTPAAEALAQGVVLEQKFVLTDEQVIRIFDLSDKLIGTIDLKHAQK